MCGLGQVPPVLGVLVFTVKWGQPLWKWGLGKRQLEGRTGLGICVYSLLPAGVKEPFAYPQEVVRSWVKACETRCRLCAQHYHHIDGETEAQRGAKQLGTLSSYFSYPPPPSSSLLQGCARPETQDSWEISTHREVCHQEVQALPCFQTHLIANPCSGG